MTDKDTTIALLTQLAISDTAARTYLAMLELDSVSIRKIAEASGINRGSTYDALKQLIAIGLVSTRHSGQREYFSAESPEKIYDIIRDKRKELLEVSRQAQQVVPHLLASSSQSSGKPLVKYYEDDEGIATILRDVLQTCRQLDRPEYYVYSSRNLRQYMYRNFPRFTEQRIAEDIMVKVIAVGEGGDRAAASERKWLAEPTGGTTSSYTLIYGNKVAVISITEDTPYGVVIEDAGAASMQRHLFEQLWTSL